MATCGWFSVSSGISIEKSFPLNYCNMLCVRLPLRTYQKLKLVQNFAAYVFTWSAREGGHSTCFEIPA